MESQLRTWIRLVEGANGDLGDVNPDEDLLLYHGAQEPLAAVRAGLLYLTPDEEEAWGYAENGHRLGVKAPVPTVHTFAAKAGKTLDIEDDNFYDEVENGDVEEHIIRRAEKARAEGYRYLTFEHPSFVAGGRQSVVISLFPHQDLTMMD